MGRRDPGKAGTNAGGRHLGGAGRRVPRRFGAKLGGLFSRRVLQSLAINAVWGPRLAPRCGRRSEREVRAGTRTSRGPAGSGGGARGGGRAGVLGRRGVGVWRLEKTATDRDRGGLERPRPVGKRAGTSPCGFSFGSASRRTQSCSGRECASSVHLYVSGYLMSGRL